MWTLIGHRAEFSLGIAVGTLDLVHVERGLAELRIARQSWPDAQLMKVQLPTSAADEVPSPVESYIRGSDLVATYPPLAPFTVQPQIYWRIRQEQSLAAAGIELIVSVQTSQLYSEPQTPISSLLAGVDATSMWIPGGSRKLVSARLPCALSAARGEEGIVACGIPAADHVYVEMIHPSDLDEMRIEAASSGVRIVQQVFQEHLEKGVIRRARICGWWLPADDWQTRAWSLYDSFLSERPPLTA